MNLSLRAGLVTLQTLHQSTSRLESEYMKSWIPSLTKSNADLEEKTNIRQGVDTSEIVLKYTAKDSNEVERNQNVVQLPRGRGRGKGRGRGRGARGASNAPPGRKLRRVV